MEYCLRCQSKIPKGAKFCPYCGHRLGSPSFKSLWLLGLVAGGLLGAGAVLLYQIFKERQLWSNQEVSFSEKLVEADDDEELMEF